MLWSDPRDEPSPEGRRALAVVHRAGPVLAACALLVLILVLI